MRVLRWVVIGWGVLGLFIGLDGAVRRNSWAGPERVFEDALTSVSFFVVAVLFAWFTRPVPGSATVAEERAAQPKPTAR